MIIAAFDVATVTGCCDGAPGAKTPRVWSWYLRDGGPSRPDRLFHFAKFLRRYFQTEPCDAVVYEEPIPIGFLARGGKKTDDKGAKGFMMSEQNVAFARGAIGVLEMTAREYGKPIEGLAVQDARQAVLGWRTNFKKKSGEDTKHRVFREVTTLYKIHCDNDNESDAWVLWAYAAARTNPAVAMQLDPLFGGPMR